MSSRWILIALTGAVAVACPPLARAQTLPSITSGTLLVHLDASAGVATDGTGTNVVTWVDQSPNSFAFSAHTQSNIFNPVLIASAQGGRPTIRFLTNGILEEANFDITLFQSNNSPITIFAAFQTTVNNSQGTIVSQEVLEPNTTFYSDMELAVDPGTRGVTTAGTFGLNRSLAASSDNTFAPANASAIISNGVFNVMTTMILSTSSANGSAPQNVQIYQNGLQQTVGAFYGGNNPQYPGWLAAGQYATGAWELDVGGRLYPTTSAFGAFFKGDISEIIIYQGTLTPYDRAQVEGYLGSKYSITIIAPPALTITTQPKPVATTNGGPASFTVAAGAGDGETDLSYQWQLNGTNIANATNTTYSIGAISAANVGAYQCVVSIPSATNTSASVALRLITNNVLPNVTTGSLLMHLQADAGVVTDSTGVNVTQWNDQSTNAFQFNTTIVGGPTTYYPALTTGLTGNPVVHFEGADDVQSTPYVQLFTDTNSPLTIFTVASVHDNSIQRYIVNSTVPRITTRAFIDLDVGTCPGNRNEPGSYGIARAAGGATVTSGTNLVPNDIMEIGTVVILPTGIAPNNVQLYQNGTFQFVQGYAAGTPDAPYTSTGWLSAGQYQTGAYPFYVGMSENASAPAVNNASYSVTGPWVGDIAEVVIYQGRLSGDDQVAVENYLGGKYGITISAPTLLSITPQPVSVALTNSGAQTITLTTGAIASTGATNFTFQWLENGTNLPGATNSTLTFNNATYSNIGAYKCIAALSSLSVTSSVAAIRLVPTNGQFVLPTVSSGSLLVHLQSDAGVETDGTGTNVTDWLDQSSNAYVFASQTGVTNTGAGGGFIVPPILAAGLTGNPVIRFNGTNDLLCTVPFQLFAASNSPITIFSTFSTTENMTQEYICNLEVVPRVGRYFDEFMMGVAAGNDGVGEFGVHRAASGATITPNNLINTGQFYTMAMTIDSNDVAPANFTFYLDTGLGTEVSEPVTGIPPGSPSDPGGTMNGWLSAGFYPIGTYEFHVGTSTDSGQATSGNTNAYLGEWNGDIAELIIYQGQLTQADRKAVEAYLDDKYGTGVPSLSIAASGTNALISWPVALGTGLEGSFVLQSTTNLVHPNWTNATPSPAVIGGAQYVVTNGITAKKFYRLKLQQ